MSSRNNPIYCLSPDELDAVRKERRFTPNDVFPLVRKWSNTPTADFVCIRVQNRVRKFLLTRRAEKPWEGEWFVPGGKIAPGIHPVTGCQQNCKRELGFVPDSEVIRFIDWYPLLNPEDQHGGESYFTQMTIFTVTISEEEAAGVVLDRTAKEMQWFENIQEEFPEPVQNILKMAGFN